MAKKKTSKNKGEKKVEKVMREYKHGELHSGSKEGPAVKKKSKRLLLRSQKPGKKAPTSQKRGDTYVS